MTKNNNDKAQYLLRKLLLFGEEATFLHRWIWEADRWKELVFALLTRVTMLPQDAVRAVTDQLHYMKLLKISTLVNLYKAHGAPDLTDSNARHILELLQEGGFKQAEAERGLTAICEAALGLHDYHASKVQNYLRSYGERMLQELGNTFRFSNLNEAEVNYAFRLWLQNVLNMPLQLQDEQMQKFCKQYELTQLDLLAAADEEDLNIALLDDLVHSYFAKQTAQANADEIKPLRR